MVDSSFIFPYLPSVLAAFLTGLGGWMAAHRMAQSNERVARIAREDKDRADRLSESHDRADDLTARFRVLMDGYELRIRDLTLEVATLRIEISQLRTELSARGNKMLTALEHIEGHDGTD